MARYWCAPGCICHWGRECGDYKKAARCRHRSRSRPCTRIGPVRGLVTLRQTFVRRRHGGACAQQPRQGAGSPAGGFPSPNASLALPCSSGGEAGGGESPVPSDDMDTSATSGCFRGHSGHQPSELSARPSALAVSPSVALLGGLSLGGLLLFELALPLLGLSDLSSVVLEDAAVALCDVCPRRRFVHKERVRRHRGEVLQRQVRRRRRPPQLTRFVGRGDAQVLRQCRRAAA
jgi:hypothetical protein